MTNEVSNIEGATLSDSFAGTQLSVIIAAGDPGENLERCLHRLVPQSRDGRNEIIVCHRSHHGALNDLKAKYPEVIFLQASEENNLPALLRIGIARSTGEIIAITDAFCEVGDGWLAAILEAHRTPRPVIGGAVEAAARKRLLNWAAYFCDYGQFMQPFKEGVADHVPGNNISFKRWTLHKGAEFTSPGFWKTYWCRKLQQEGIQLTLTPSIVVHYNKSYRLLPFLRRRFHHGRCFAGMRAAQVSCLRRVAYLISSPLLPVIFLMRVVNTVVPKRRHLKEFMLSSPLVMLAIACWSLGEFCGYLGGTGKSCAYIY